MVYLRNTSARIPKHLEDKLSQYSSVKCVLYRGLEGEKSDTRVFRTGIGFYAIPRDGSSPRVEIDYQNIEDINPEEDGKLVAIAKGFLANEDYISKILEGNSKL